MSRFSVIIPVYNDGRHLARAIDSVLAQADVGVEILVVDDGSTDDTAAVAARYLNRVQYLYQTHRGPAAARNRGAALALGEWLVFLDVADCLLPGAFARFREEQARAPDADFLFGGYVSVRGGERRVRFGHALSGESRRDFADWIFQRFAIPTSAACIRRRVFETECFPEALRGPNDMVFFARLLATRQVASFPSPVVEMHAHAGQQRENAAQQAASAEQVTEQLFDPAHLPAALLDLRAAFWLERQQELMRMQYSAGAFAEAARMGWQLLRQHPWQVTRPRFLARWIQAVVRGWQEPKPSPAPWGTHPLPRPHFERHTAGQGRRFIHRCAEKELISQDLDLHLPASRWSAWVRWWRNVE